MSQQFTKAQVAEHKDEKSGMYIIIDTGVYDVASMFFLFFISVSMRQSNQETNHTIQNSLTTTPAAPRS